MKHELGLHWQWEALEAPALIFHGSVLAGASLLAASLLENMLPNSGLGRVGNKPPGKDVLRLEGINTLAPVVFRFS